MMGVGLTGSQKRALILKILKEMHILSVGFDGGFTRREKRIIRRVSMVIHSFPEMPEEPLYIRIVRWFGRLFKWKL